MEMTTEQAKIAVIEERVNRHRSDISRAFERVGGIESKMAKDDIHRVRSESRQEEMSASIDSLGHNVESAIKEFREAMGMMGEIGTRLKAIEETLDKDLVSIKNRITRIEEKEIDIVIIIKWLGTWRGTFFMCFIFCVSIGVLVPDAREFILSMFGIASKVG